jgi:hypothetical protein
MPFTPGIVAAVTKKSIARAKIIDMLFPVRFVPVMGYPSMDTLLSARDLYSPDYFKFWNIVIIPTGSGEISSCRNLADFKRRTPSLTGHRDALLLFPAHHRYLPAGRFKKRDDSDSCIPVFRFADQPGGTGAAKSLR